MIKNTRKKLGLSQEKFAIILDVSHRSVSRWENGDIRFYKGIKDMIIRLEKMFGNFLFIDDELYYWLIKPQACLKNHPPLDLLKSDYASEILEKMINDKIIALPFGVS